MDEKKLLRRMKKGDDSALEQTINEYSPYVASIVRQIIGVSMSTEDVEEVCADVFFTLWQQAEQVRSGHLKGYLSAIARHKALNKLRERGETVELEEDIILPEEQQPERICTEKEQKVLVETALLQMGQPDREIFLRHYYYCQSVAVIGSSMDMNPSTVKSRLARGRKKLKKLLTEGGFLYENQ